MLERNEHKDHSAVGAIATESTGLLQVIPENIPQSLKDRQQWLVWRLQTRSGTDKPTKVPYDAKTTGYKGKSNDQSTWSDFDTAINTYKTGSYSGIGFAFSSDDGFTGIDLDHVIDEKTGEIESWAEEILNRFGHTYSELSPSGTGFRIFCLGTPVRCGKGGDNNRLEVYNYTSPRYLTVTGHSWQERNNPVADAQEALAWLHDRHFTKSSEKKPSPSLELAVITPSLEDEEIIRKAISAANGKKVQSLLTGRWEGCGYPSQSEADAALCAMLAFHTKDKSQLDRIFRSSKLMRPKWDEIHHADGRSYGDATIDAAIEISASCDERSTAKRKGASCDEGKRSQVDLLLELAKEFEVFHDPDQNGYARVLKNGVKQNFAIRSSSFKQLLSGLFYDATGKGSNSTVLNDALCTIEAKAVHGGPEAPVYLRTARVEDVIYIDLCNEKWEVIEVTADGWKVIDDSPVYFMRKYGMLSLPTPVRGGNIQQLRRFLNVEDKDFFLVVGWVLGAFRGAAPYQILVLQGQQGCGKSTTSKVLRSLIDPSTVQLRPQPKDVKELSLSAINNFLVVLDNLSGVSPELSDCLCRFSTGGGLDVRKLYTDSEQLLVQIERPVLTNGIDDIATRPDLMERSIILNLPVITESGRRSEKSFWDEFEIAKPAILGALLDALSCALRNESSTHLPVKPRMADCAIFVTAAEPALGWESGTFLAAHSRNQDESVEIGIETSSVGSALLELLEKRGGSWTGTLTGLLDQLNQQASGELRRSGFWPKTLKMLRNELSRLKPSLRRLGIEIQDKRTAKERLLEITKAPRNLSFPSHLSQPLQILGLPMTVAMTEDDSMTDKTPAMTHSEAELSSREPNAQAPDDASDEYDDFPEIFSIESLDAWIASLA